MPELPATVQVREMREEDVEQVVIIERASCPTPWSSSAFLGEITSNNLAHYVVALAEDRVVGYAGMWFIFDEAHITTIAVDPDRRGQGFGHMLLSELERRALARGMKRMTLEVRPSNPVAQNLYKGHGFEPKGRRRGYYTDTREDAIIMWKDKLTPENP